MGALLLSIASPEYLSWFGFAVLGAALVGEAGICIAPIKWDKFHKELAFVLAILAAAGYAVERIGDDAILASVRDRASIAERALTDFRSPRSLSPQQLDAIKLAINPFAGTIFDAATAVEDSEQLSLLWTLSKALREAGWRQMPWTYSRGGIVYTVGEGEDAQQIGSVASDNVVIQLHRESVDGLKPAVEALANALVAANIVTTASLLTASNGNSKAVHLMVGRKR